MVTTALTNRRHWSDNESRVPKANLKAFLPNYIINKHVVSANSNLDYHFTRVTSKTLLQRYDRHFREWMKLEKGITYMYETFIAAVNP